MPSDPRSTLANQPPAAPPPIDPNGRAGRAAPQPGTTERPNTGAPPSNPLATPEPSAAQIAPAAEGAPPLTASAPAHSLDHPEPQPQPALGRWGIYWQRVQQYWDSRKTPALLISLILHVSILLLLAFLTFSGQVGMQDGFDFTIQNEANNQEQLTSELKLAAGDSPPPPTSNPEQDWEPPLPAETASTSISELLTLATSEQTTPQPDAAVTELQQLVSGSATSLTASFSGSGVEGRQLLKRQELALARGGTLESEQAVERALEWLAAHQMPSGGWSLVHTGGECNERCGNPGSHERFDPAATGLSLLAFLGAGYTHLEGKHKETVRRGVYFLYQILEETPNGGSFLYQSERGMYNHGIAAFAMCEAYQLTQDRDLLKPAQQAVDFIVHAQSYQGGWGYLPKKPGDLTISGWQMMALKSAQAAGLEIPDATILAIDIFLDTQQAEESSFFGYARPGKSPTCTAIGNMIRLFRGMSHTDPRILQSAAFLNSMGHSGTDAYYNYYVSLYLFHVGDPFWERWNPRVRDYLVRSQANYGHEAGSWYFDNPYGKEGGRLYTTAMCAMTLEVYYRFSPLYQQSDQPFEL
ncbi:prenyltransferase/squalene oxidase repeat-containing protein [Aureliella helgolandensis]|uniref:Prenyltransferase and squalene oxidase repeat protein n=1 Tax=Aureliella helgolandensis TaxID=2527968 RepID=A0A518G2F8_9BACT|nr:prenyltransferase/squalene oxidase repeat-containing protein [Aureliella helgolandensis]QDV22778.1 Prenyltransferase and squalene oxidase repeat protein [Aureliella helgolandensis]